MKKPEKGKKERDNERRKEARKEVLLSIWIQPNLDKFKSYFVEQRGTSIEKQYTSR
jgi:hypothetical protein